MPSRAGMAVAESVEGNGVVELADSLPVLRYILLT